MVNALDVLMERGFIEDITDRDGVEEYFKSGSVVCYLGFDPTASSFHVGNLIPIMALSHIHRCGNKIIALLGGGTARVGDPTGKVELRQFLSNFDIIKNVVSLKEQLSRFIDFNVDSAQFLNNADWLDDLGYLSFLRNIGRYFSINKMIKMESYKRRLSSNYGLNFVELNYMLLQAYDFNKLYEDYGCCLQVGGKDQWGNIVAGIDLIRRINRKTVFGLVFPLLMNSSGVKMGKTTNGSTWLDSDKTSPYDYYQFWVNVNDEYVEKFMGLFTFLPMQEISMISTFDVYELNCVKNILAFEVTCLVHGREEAMIAHKSSLALFGDRNIPEYILPSSSIIRQFVNLNEFKMPSIKMELELFRCGIPAFKLFVSSCLVSSSSAVRRLVKQGGLYINGDKVIMFDQIINDEYIIDSKVVLAVGKKKFLKINVNM